VKFYLSKNVFHNLIHRNKLVRIKDSDFAQDVINDMKRLKRTTLP